MASNLYKFENQIIFAKPGRKPYIENVQQLFCNSPDARRGTRVVSGDIIEGLNASILYSGDLASKYFVYITWRFNLRSIEINTNIEAVIYNNTIAWNANDHLTSVAAYIIVKGIAGDFDCEDQSRRMQWTATVLVVSILPDT